MIETTNRGIDPYKLIGSPDTWGEFTNEGDDAVADNERRQLALYFEKRLRKKRRGQRDDAAYQASLLCGAAAGYVGLFMAMAGGPDKLPADAFDRLISIITFSWHQASEIYGSAHP